MSADHPRFIIYGLVDPRDAEVRYIGKSTSGLHRPATHARPSGLARLKHTHKSRWILGLRALGLRYGILVLECLKSESGLNDAETKWIADGRRLGWRLTNVTDGGEGTSGLRPPQSAIDATRTMNTGRKHTPEAIAAISAAAKGRKRTPEQIAKYVATRRASGKWPAFPKQSEEAVRRRVESRKAGVGYAHIPPTKEQRAKQSASLKAWWKAKKEAALGDRV